MNIRSTSLLALVAVIAALSSAVLSAAPTPTAAVALPVGSVNNKGWEIAVGTSRQQLLNRFGAPQEKLADHVWIYRGFHPVQKQAQALNCTTLMVTITDGTVTAIQLVNPRARAIITARLQTAAPAMVALAK